MTGPADEQNDVGQQRPLVLHVLDRFDIGGMEIVALNLIGQTRDRYTHRVLCLRDVGVLGARLDALGVDFETIGKRPGKDISAYMRLLRRLRRLSPDIVHTYNIGAIDVALWSRLAGVRRVVHAEHGRDAADPNGNNVKYRWMRRLLAPLINRFVAVSSDLAEWLTHDVGIDAAKTRLIRNGIDVERFRPAPSPFDPVDSLVEGDKMVRIGTVGRLDRVKDFGTLINAFAVLCDDLPNNRLELMIVGEGGERATLEQQVTELGLGDRVTLTGPRDDVEQLLHTLDIYVCSSIAEGVALTILEAMASSLPIVATNVGGNPELVIAGETGILVASGAPGEMAAAIRTLVESPEQARAYGVAGRVRARAQFSLETMRLQYCQLYDELLDH
ncbi:TIGR03088 family PEP-CTERM/XrtA system glycosyltransferase [Salinisphaera aquimarina]|uniref:TIGR03088 family PEP-CTERM/XrtA system glycosyltransferase n=1 Tax=Salinisphaera aquimarina TaxID=2094031 RepID=A0ABV7EQ25_9GAMM